MHGRMLWRIQVHYYECCASGGCGKVKLAVRIIIVSAPKLQSQPQQVNHFCPMQSHPTFKRAFFWRHARESRPPLLDQLEH